MGARSLPHGEEPPPAAPEQHAENGQSPATVWDQAPRVSARQLCLDHAAPLSEALCRTFSDTLGYARSLEERAAAEPDEAVHEFRKSMRRLRAVLKLLGPAVAPEESARLMDRMLRDAARATSSRRDASVLAGALDSLPASRGTGHALRRKVRAHLAGKSRSALGPDRPAELLATLNERVAWLPGMLRQALPGTLAWSDLLDMMRISFRRTRRAMVRAIASVGQGEIHAFRRRVKELRYQIEMLRYLGEPRVEEEHRRLADLAEKLGVVTDLILLSSALKEARAGWSGGSLAPMRALCRREILRRFGESIALACETLLRRPRQFAAALEPALPDRRRRRRPAHEPGSEPAPTPEAAPDPAP